MRYCFYNHDTPVRLSFDGRTITLFKNLQFGLDFIDGRTVVVLDGFRYPVPGKYVSVLKKRSLPAKIPKQALRTRHFFESFGHTALKYVESRAAKYGKLAGSGFSQNVAYAEVRDTFGQDSVRIMFRISSSSVGVSIYRTEARRFDKTLRTNLQKTAHELARRMELKFSISVGDFRAYTAQFANIMLPDGSHFSGHAWTYAARWSFVE